MTEVSIQEITKVLIPNVGSGKTIGITLFQEDGLINVRAVANEYYGLEHKQHVLEQYDIKGMDDAKAQWNRLIEKYKRAIEEAEKSEP